jgi:hypothetical protein
MATNELPGGSESEEEAHRPIADSHPEQDHVITAEDAGWLTPTHFVAPASFVAFDPPIPRSRNNRTNAQEHHEAAGDGVQPNTDD